MRKPIRIAMVAGAAGAIVAGGTATAVAVQGDSQPTKAINTTYSTSATTAPASPKAAGKVNAGQARHIAQQRVPGGMVTETDFDHEHGKAVWEVDLTGQHREYEIHIDAVTGKVLSVHTGAGMADNH
jgi:uncharacterized membrane protein YkoI